MAAVRNAAAPCLACCPGLRADFADELVLEPSAGTGMLAVWAAKAGARLALNEISPLRRDCLSALFPAARVTGHDGELIDELLDRPSSRASC
jgi:predicted RNA methylase